jgi:hypothetical protein
MQITIAMFIGQVLLGSCANYFHLMANATALTESLNCQQVPKWPCFSRQPLRLMP